MNIHVKPQPAPEERRFGSEVLYLLGQLVDHRWLIVAVTALFVACGVLYSLCATPIYSADARVQVEQKNVGSLLAGMTQMIPGSLPASAAELEIITSRRVLGKTVSDLGLDIVVSPEYLPLIGKGLAQMLGRSPGTLRVSRLTLPAGLSGQRLTLEVTGEHSYRISAGGETLFDGEVCQLVQQHGIVLLVSSLQAKRGSRFIIHKLSDLQAIKRVSDNLTVADRGKDSGVLGLMYRGEDPRLIDRVLDRLIANYLFQNVTRKSEEAEKSLAFLQRQLPEVRNQLGEAEDTLSRFRRQNDSVDMSLEAKSALDSAVNIQSQLNELTFREADVSQRFTKDHPTYRALIEKRRTLEDEQKKLSGKISLMPQIQQEIVRLTRDVQAGQDVYMQLLNRQQELSISKASTLGDVRVIDSARTAINPVTPKRTLLVAASLLLGLAASVGVVLVKALLHHGVEHPQQLNLSGMRVYASVPLSAWQRKQDARTRAKPATARPGCDVRLLATHHPDDLAIEALRGLRTALHFSQATSANNILMITGVAPGIGKTFVSVNLALLAAKTCARTLLIDGDMRRGYVHELLGRSCESGLSTLLAGTSPSAEQAVQRGAFGFDFIARGPLPAEPSELLMSAGLSALLSWAGHHYDLVVITTPPVLAVTDASIVGSQAGTSLLVARYATTTLKEIAASYQRFAENGLKIDGVILNGVVRKPARILRSGDDYYQYSYQKKPPAGGQVR